jgi:hypothetical protein
MSSSHFAQKIERKLSKMQIEEKLGPRRTQADRPHIGIKKPPHFWGGSS